MTAPRDRAGELAAFYARHQRNLERIVNCQVRAPGTIVEDACQTAWTSLCAHPEVDLHDQRALRWLVTTATREAWKHSQRLTARETPAGAFRATGDVDPLELAEPAAEHPSPSELAIAHAEHAQRVHRLRALSDRERSTSTSKVSDTATPRWPRARRRAAGLWNARSSAHARN